MIRISRTIMIDESEIQEFFIHSSGPGGQNVNKVATSVQLRFDVAKSRSLPEEVRKRLLSLAGKRITDDGVLIIDARRFRTQGKNREDATSRLVALIRKAAQKPPVRHQTRPTLSSKIRRLETKRHDAASKRSRTTIYSHDA